MYILDFNKPAKLHFTGIGGISMSALAEIMLSKGFEVTGSDAKKSEITEHLESLGATVFYGQRIENVSSDIEVFKEIFTSEEVMICKENDTQSYINGFKELISHMDTFGSKVKKRFESDYSPEAFFKKHIEIYNEVLK